MGNLNCSCSSSFILGDKALFTSGSYHNTNKDITYTQNPSVLCKFINRIGGTGSSRRFIFIVDEAIQWDDKETFVITSKDNKPCIKGTTILAVTTGINWYLNHYLHINISWNQLTVDLSEIELVLPTKEEKHVCQMDYRYYLNYCTFSYSMSVWTWDRWQKEIDWMALHGVNMPLQIIGLDVVWKKLLTEDLGYSSDEANKFIAGPCFQAWWGMNNLEGWGGPNKDWWYTRQETLAKNILARERELGMEPVLPGYAGMVPSDIASKKGYSANNQGNWCTFVRPYILDPNSTAFSEVSELYYKRLAELMGTSTYYSMDPFHEGANTDGIDVPPAYKKIYNAMHKAKEDAKWVIQFWQWSDAQYNVLSQVDQGKLIILDLSSDCSPHFSEYKGHDSVYCILPNFGGRTGIFGRLEASINNYYTDIETYQNIKGVGAVPEGIGQNSILYDALYELPWRLEKPQINFWVHEYVESRYGEYNESLYKAWNLIKNSALNCQDEAQGPQEALICARPAQKIDRVSSWGSTKIFYNTQDLIQAAYLFLTQRGNYCSANYKYDLINLLRQILTDLSQKYFEKIQEQEWQERFLQLILDIDALLNSDHNFMIGSWLKGAQDIIAQTEYAPENAREWLEGNNARTLITTWGNEESSEKLHDYSWREMGGILKDLYYERWKKFFEDPSYTNWYEMEQKWALNMDLIYGDTAIGDPIRIANALFNKYFLIIGDTVIPRRLETEVNVTFTAYRGKNFEINASEQARSIIAFQTTDNLSVNSGSLAIPQNAITGKFPITITFTDNTVLKAFLIIRDEISKQRKVAVSYNGDLGTCSIDGRSDNSISTINDVPFISQTTQEDAIFVGYWEDSTLLTLDTEYLYCGKDSVELEAKFQKNVWKSPQLDYTDWGDDSNSGKSFGQYLTELTVCTQNTYKTLYSTSTAPNELYYRVQEPTLVKDYLSISWKAATDSRSKSGLAINILRAYIYNNGNWKLIKKEGNASVDTNIQLNNYILQISLQGKSKGLSMIRLRFDSSWDTREIDADSESKRMVYDIPIIIY